MQVAAHEVSEKIKRLPGKGTRQQSLLSYMESEHESDNDPRSPAVVIQEVPLLSPVEMHASAIKRSSTSYSLVSIDQS